MELGTGVFLSALILSTVILYVATKDRWNWRRIAKWAVIIPTSFAVLAAIIIYGTFRWNEFQSAKADAKRASGMVGYLECMGTKDVMTPPKSDCTPQDFGVIYIEGDGAISLNVWEKIEGEQKQAERAAQESAKQAAATATWSSLQCEAILAKIRKDSDMAKSGYGLDWANEADEGRTQYDAHCRSKGGASRERGKPIVLGEFCESEADKRNLKGNYRYASVRACIIGNIETSINSETNVKSSHAEAVQNADMYFSGAWLKSDPKYAGLLK